MRQAGRYMPEYRKMQETLTFEQMCKRPELAAQITLMAVDQLGVDAAIIFSDILFILEPLGAELSYIKGVGPKIANPVRGAEDVAALREPDVSDTMIFVMDALRLVRRALDPAVALIGFCGAPFTLASYLIEGGSSRRFLETKKMMYTMPETWHTLMSRLTRALVEYLNLQKTAGAQALQIFDSWVGCLSEADYRTYVLPYTKALLDAVHTDETPIIHFGTGNAVLLDIMKEAGESVIGLDWRVDFATTWTHLGDVAVQGNLDPAILLCGTEVIQSQAQRILSSVAGRPGHIFNLGHGVLPMTPIEHVRFLVDTVREYSSQS